MKDFKRGNVPRETIDTLTSKSRGIIYIIGSQVRHAVRMEEKDNNNNDNKLDSYIYIYMAFRKRQGGNRGQVFHSVRTCSVGVFVFVNFS